MFISRHLKIQANFCLKENGGEKKLWKVVNLFLSDSVLYTSLVTKGKEKFVEAFLLPLNL